MLLTWQRHTTSTSVAIISTTFPLPSSPHCAPRTTVTLELNLDSLVPPFTNACDDIFLNLSFSFRSFFFLLSQNYSWKTIFFLNTHHHHARYTKNRKWFTNDGCSARWKQNCRENAKSNAFYDINFPHDFIRCHRLSHFCKCHFL